MTRQGRGTHVDGGCKLCLATGWTEGPALCAVDSLAPHRESISQLEMKFQLPRVRFRTRIHQRHGNADIVLHDCLAERLVQNAPSLRVKP